MNRATKTASGTFEYWELEIPLELRLEGARYPTRRELQRFHGGEGVVMQHLNAAAREEWLADELADWDSLLAAGRFTATVEPSEGEGSVTVYTSVTIRLKRLAGTTHTHTSTSESST